MMLRQIVNPPTQETGRRDLRLGVLSQGIEER